MVNAFRHTRTTVIGDLFKWNGSKFDLIDRNVKNEVKIKSHLDLPQSVGIFRKDRFSRLEKINKQIESAVSTATKLVSSWMMPVVSTSQKTVKRSTLFRIGSVGRLLQQIKEHAVEQMKAYDNIVSEAKKKISSWQTPVENNVRHELVYNTGKGQYNYGRFELREVVAGRRQKGIQVIMREAKIE